MSSLRQAVVVSEFVLLARPGELFARMSPRLGVIQREYIEQIQFITTPPGGSAWANRLITEKLGFFLSETGRTSVMILVPVLLGLQKI